MLTTEAVFWLAVAASLFYAYYNGANDAPNSVAAAIRTGAMSFHTAVLLSAILNASGPFFATAVAKTIASGIVPPDKITQAVVLGGLLGAIFWSGLATHKGIPVSITHSLIGGILGAGMAFGGLGFPKWAVLYYKVFLGIALAPLTGFVAAAVTLFAIKWLVYFFFAGTPHASLNRFWRKGQILSSAFLSWSHGLNDGQNAVGIITLAYFVAGFSTEVEIRLWMIVLPAIAMGTGTYISGRKVIKTTGWDIVNLQPADGFAAQTASALTLVFKSSIGWPVSTTHVAVGGILGTGAVKNPKAVKKGVTADIFIAWILTIPAAALFGAIGYWIVDKII